MFHAKDNFDIKLTSMYVPSDKSADRPKIGLSMIDH